LARLPHVCASGLVERHLPLAEVHDLLGRESILSIERYDNQTLKALPAAVERLDGGKTLNSVRLKPDTTNAEAGHRER
jgi:hypothetical protein